MDINLTLLMQAVAFGLFIWFTATFVWPPLAKAIDDRQKQIADGLAAAERGKQDFAQAEKRVAEVVSEAKARATEIVTLAEKQRSETIERAKAEALAEAEKVKAMKLAELEQEVVRAKEMLRNQVADLAVAGAEKILRREVDAKAHADLLAAIRQEL